MNRHSLVCVACVVVFASMVCLAAETASLLPAFGPQGHEVANEAKDNNKITGWLPAGWVDNSEWAAVSATYTKLEDAPKPGLTAINIKVTTVDEGHLQLTSWTRPVFKQNVKYIVEGFIRSKSHDGLRVGIREPGEPYEFYAEQDLDAGPQWKPFKFDFTFDVDRPAFVMFIKPETGSVDLAGVVVHQAD